MNSAELTRLTAQALTLVLMLSLPALAVSLVVGLVMGVVQTMTQIQEQTLAFVPKLIAVGLALVIGGSWMGGEMVRFTSSLWTSLPNLVH